LKQAAPEPANVEVDDPCDDDSVHEFQKPVLSSAETADAAGAAALGQARPILVDDPSQGDPVEIGRDRIRRMREGVRPWVAILVIGPVWIAEIFAWIEFFFRVTDPKPVEVEAFAIALLGPLIGVTGAVVGFYFGERDR
jgi:hypothetical protein